MERARKNAVHMKYLSTFKLFENVDGCKPHAIVTMEKICSDSTLQQQLQTTATADDDDEKWMYDER